MKNLKTYFSSAVEREAIRRRRLAGEPPPWTADAVFREWRFCNVRREDDKTTVWFREQVRSKLDGLAVVEATMIFRWFNRIEVGERIVDLLLNGWDRKEARRRLANITPVTNAAYMVNTPPGFGKLDGVLECIDMARPFLPALVERWGWSLEQAWRDLLPLPRVGGFVAYEVVTDLRWTPVFSFAHDITTWAAAGPGCARGLGYLIADDPLIFNYGSARDQTEMLTLMQNLVRISRQRRYWPYQDAPWEMREAEMWACEFCKYTNAVNGRRLKRRFAA